MSSASSRYRPIVYIEGVRVPVLGYSVQAAIGAPTAIKIALPPIPFFKSDWRFISMDSTDSTSYLQEEDPSEEDTPSALERVVIVDAHGVQPKSAVHIFEKDEKTGEEIFITEGRVTQTRYVSNDVTAMLEVIAEGNLSYALETQMFMTDLSRDLGITTGFSSNRTGTATGSSVINTLVDEGLADGIVKLMEQAGTGANDYLNLVWRLFRIKQHIQVINNPEALGHFNSTRLRTMLSKRMDQIPNRQAIISLILFVLDTIRYFIVNTVAPSFINAQYEDDYSRTPSTDEIEPDGDELETNQILIMPSMMFAPPPRCNVIFPCQYKSFQYDEDFSKRPTRGFARKSSTATLNETASTDRLIILPEEVAQGVRDHGQYWSSPEEKYRGQIMSAFSYQRPEFLDEMGSDFVRGYMKIQYEQSKYANNALALGDCTFNIKPIIGLPTLVFCRDGNHKIAVLKGLSVEHSPERNPQVVYTFDSPRPYDEPIPKEATELWYEQEMFAQKHIGTRIFPLIIGETYAYALQEDPPLDPETQEALGDTSSSDSSSNTSVDLSILAILAASGMTDAEIEAAKEAATAIKTAADAIYSEYRNSGNLDMYAYYFGRRKPIGIKQLMSDLYGARSSSDLFSFAGGYTAETNSLNLRDGSEIEKEIGEPIPDDMDIGGCFYLEKQNAILEAANTVLGMALSSIAMEMTQFLNGQFELIGPIPEEDLPDTEEATAPPEDVGTED